MGGSGKATRHSNPASNRTAALPRGLVASQPCCLPRPPARKLASTISALIFERPRAHAWVHQTQQIVRIAPGIRHRARAVSAQATRKNAIHMIERLGEQQDAFAPGVASRVADHQLEITAIVAISHHAAVGIRFQNQPRLCPQVQSISFIPATTNAMVGVGVAVAGSDHGDSGSACNCAVRQSPHGARPEIDPLEQNALIVILPQQLARLTALAAGRRSVRVYSVPIALASSSSFGLRRCVAPTAIENENPISICPSSVKAAIEVVVSSRAVPRPALRSPSERIPSHSALAQHHNESTKDKRIVG